MAKSKKLVINGAEITVMKFGDEDYICITDMVKNLDGGSAIIENWLRNKNTIEFLAVWEQLNNPGFNSLEFEGIRKEAGLNRFHLSAKKWVKTTNAKGIISKTGRYGGTYVHKDIAFEFGTWISPAFKLFLIKEYERLQNIENNQYNLEWNVGRILSSMNYKLQTDAVKDYIIPKSIYPKNREWLHYAEEADILNVAIWGYTKKDWINANPQLVLGNKNQRDYASINELLVITRLETLNADMIKNGKSKEERFDYLKSTAKEMLEKLNEENFIKSVQKKSETTYIELEKPEGLDNGSKD